MSDLAARPASTPPSRACGEFLDLVERIEDAVRLAVNGTVKDSLSGMLKQLHERRPHLPHIQDMESLVRMRNLLVHNGGCVDPLFQPSERSIAALRKFHNALVRPRLAVHLFKGPVETFAPDVPLVNLLKTINARDYSQFPIVDQGVIIGVVTEHSIARYVARRVAGGKGLVDFDSVTVRHVILDDASREHYSFAKPTDPEDVFVGRFLDSMTLEALLITEHGTPNSNLVGLATVWDVTHIEESAAFKRRQVAEHLRVGDWT